MPGLHVNGSRAGRLPYRRLAAAGGALLLVALVGPAVDTSDAAADPTANTAAQASVDSLAWTNCPGPGALPGAQCATLKVPLDWAEPERATISLALSKLPATDPAHRIGPLLLNPGGPGGSGVQAVGYDASLSSAPELASLRQRFDIIGFDPRGVGASTPVTCGVPLHDPKTTTFPRTPAAFASLKQLNHTAGESCVRQTGALIDHVDTLSVVRDVDAIRHALGVRQVSWIGLSYGTEIGELYAQRYPHRVRAMVLDGVVDHSRPARVAAVDEALAEEKEFGRFADWCAATTTCPLHGADVPALFDKLMSTAQGAGVPAAALQRNATAEELTSGAYGYLYRHAAWPLLAGALAKAAGLAGPADASGLVAAAEFADPQYDAYRTVGCHDFAPKTDGFLDMAVQEDVLRTVAPHMWRYSEFWDWTSGCVGWPVHPANPPSPLHVRDTAPILLVNTTYDPATPYVWAQAVAARIQGSRLLTVTGDGHTGILHSSCARTQEAQYLVTTQLPAAGLTCTATNKPPTGTAANGG